MEEIPKVQVEPSTQQFMKSKKRRVFIHVSKKLQIRKKLLDTVLLVEFINTAARVDEFLLTCVKRVALGADFNRNILLRAAGLVNSTACALYNSGFVVGMNAFLHNVQLLIMCCLDCA